jgi:hypothetical protein
LLTGLVIAATFVLRWLTLDFENDYFMHMAWAAQMLRGEWPVRDFVEPGFPLQTWLAYLGLRLGGYQLSWEGFIACALIAISTGLTYLLCRRLGVPRWLTLLVVVIAAATYPRLYTYPKAFVYPAALWTLARYLDRPSRRSLLFVATATAVAFLFRHDHGVWIVPPTVAALALRHWREPLTFLRSVVAYGAVAAVLVAPWTAWVALSGHADQYLAFLLERSEGSIDRTRLPAQTFTRDAGAPLVTVAPVQYPVVGIRWAPTASIEDRRRLEQRYSLDPIRDSADRYRLTDVRGDNVRALVSDPMVEDTSGIDRGSLRVPEGGFPWMYQMLQRYVPIVRLRVLPGVISASNAEPWLTDVTFFVPWVALVMLCGSLIVRRPSGWDDPATCLIVATATLSIITYQTLVRASPDSRLGDIAGPTAVLLGWLLWKGWTLRPRVVYFTRPLVAVLLLLTCGSAMSYGRIVGRLDAAGVNGPTNFARRLFGVGTLFGTRPLDLYSPPGATGLARLSRWVNECTVESDRIALIGFEPQVFFLSERGFAGGLAFYDLGWNSSDRDQALVLQRWSRERVPIVLAMETEWGSFSRDYPAIRAWIDARYDVVEQSSFGGGKPVTVLTLKSMAPVSKQAATGLPCFR